MFHGGPVWMRYIRYRVEWVNCIQNDIKYLRVLGIFCCPQKPLNRSPQNQKSGPDKQTPWQFPFQMFVSIFGWPQESEDRGRKPFKSEWKFIKINKQSKSSNIFCKTKYQVNTSHDWYNISIQIYIKYIFEHLSQKQTETQRNEGLALRHNIEMGRVTMWHGVGQWPPSEKLIQDILGAVKCQNGKG